MACEFVNLSVCVGVLNQILSNCRLNLVRKLIICSLNLANFNLCLAEFNHFDIACVSALLKFDQANAGY